MYWIDKMKDGNSCCKVSVFVAFFSLLREMYLLYVQVYYLQHDCGHGVITEGGLNVESINANI